MLVGLAIPIKFVLQSPSDLPDVWQATEERGSIQRTKNYSKQ